MIEQIDINGVSHPFLFSIRAVREIDRIEKKKEDVDDFEMAFLMGWLGLKYGYLASKREIKFTREDFEGWVDVDPSILENISKIVVEQSNKVTEKMGNLKTPKV